jgi:hypothetical protein
VIVAIRSVAARELVGRRVDDPPSPAVAALGEHHCGPGSILISPFLRTRRPVGGYGSEALRPKEEKIARILPRLLASAP